MKRKILLQSAAVGSALVVAAFAALASGSKSGDSNAAERNKAAHWTYTGAEGPANWGRLSPAYELCGIGRKQSPIDITGQTPADLKPIKLDYKATPISVVNNGHTIQVNYAPGSTMKIGANTYQLVQFHFHSPSEHKVGGRSYAGEAHFVHKSADGKLAVLGVLIEIGVENDFLKPIWASMPPSKGANSYPSKMLDPNNFLPAGRAYNRYIGSLTTPPCSEGVSWYVLREPVSMSRAQADEFRNTISANARPVQAMHKRVLQKSR